MRTRNEGTRTKKAARASAWREYLAFEVRLAEIQPPIRRRFLLVPTATFFDLHEAIQDSFGWGGYHMWAFHGRGRDPAIAGIPSPEDFGLSPPDARKVKLASYFGEKRAARCIYLYDFGDDWGHEVRYAGRERQAGAFRRCLVDGAAQVRRRTAEGSAGTNVARRSCAGGCGRARRRRGSYGSGSGIGNLTDSTSRLRRGDSTGESDVGGGRGAACAGAGGRYPVRRNRREGALSRSGRA